MCIRDRTRGLPCMAAQLEPVSLTKFCTSLAKRQSINFLSKNSSARLHLVVHLFYCSGQNLQKPVLSYLYTQWWRQTVFNMLNLDQFSLRHIDICANVNICSVFHQVYSNFLFCKFVFISFRDFLENFGITTRLSGLR